MKSNLLIIVIFLLGLNISAQTINGSFESKFKRYQKNESFTGTETLNWNTVAWKGDRIHNQILLWSSSNVNGLSYAVSDLVKGSDQIASSNVKLRLGKYIKGDPEARSCSEYPTHPAAVEIIDALSDETVTSLTVLDPLKLWVTINVPSATVTGVYSGTITVNGGADPLVFNIEVNIVNYILPDVANWNFHLDLWQFPVKILNHYNTANSSDQITIWSDEHFALFEPGYKILADMGQKAITTQIKEGALGMPSMIKWIKKTNGTWEYDYTAFDKYVTALMSLGITKQIDCFSPVGWNEDVIPYWDEATNAQIDLSAPLGSAEFNTRWDHFLTAFKTHLDIKGWFDKAVLYLDEVSEEKLLNVASVVHGNNPNWKLGIAYSHGLSNASKENFYDLSGILKDASNEGISEDKISTFYTSCSQTQPNSYVTPENSLAEMTWMSWHAQNEGYDGYLRWAYDYWRLSNLFDARDGAHTAGDFSMVYRTSNNSDLKYLPSLRLVMLRDGIQDYEKIKILKAALESVTDAYSQEVLNSFNTIISKFGKTSGSAAEQLIIEGQKAIEEISLGTFSYCKVNGGATTDYYIKSVATTGGDANLNFSTNQYPNTGYEHHTSSKISIQPTKIITFTLANSTASNCARTKVWVDWNNDEDFEDAGEEVFSGGAANSCTNNINYSFEVMVPASVSNGVKRIRMQVKDASDVEPESCGINDKTGTVDFDLEVLDVYCKPQGASSQDYFVTSLTTSGGIGSNIDFNSIGFPTNGYEHHTLTKVIVETEATFNVILKKSAATKCARTRVWIDWNQDHDFDDSGELIYDGDILQSCENTIEKTINIQVPANALVGTTRMRVRIRDAWLANPEPCGTATYTAASDFNVEIKKKPFGVSDDNFEIQTTGETCPNKNNGKILIKSKVPYDFKIIIEGITYTFTSELLIENLTPKQYDFCITTTEDINYIQCFGASIEKSEIITGKTSITKIANKTQAVVSLNSGTPPFTIRLNDELVAKIFSTNYELNVNHGDIISVSTDKQCQGKFIKEIRLLDTVFAYPNPTKDNVEIYFGSGNTRNSIPIQICNLYGQKVSLKDYKINNNKAVISLKSLPSGIYVVKLELNTTISIKIIKQ